MPLFKFCTGIEYVGGDVVIPFLCVEGEATLLNEGNLVLPSFVVSGGVAAAGEAGVPVLRVLGQMQNEASGNVDLPRVLTDGEAFVTAAITGAVSIPFMGILGDMQAEGLMLLPALQAIGFAQVEGFVSGGVRIPLLSVSGAGVRSEWADGNAKFPLLSARGSVARTGAISNSQFAFPLLHCMGFASAASEYEYNEDDAALRYADARRYI